MEIVLIILLSFIAVLGWLSRDTNKKFKVIAIILIFIIGIIQFFLVKSVKEEKASKSFSGSLNSQETGFNFDPKIKRVEFGWTPEKRGAVFAFENQITDVIPSINNPNTRFLSFFRELSVYIDKKTNYLLVSMILRDNTGSLIAKLENNDWKVAPPPKTFDRNYNKNTLEIINDKGNIILQIRLLGDTVQINGVFYGEGGSGIEIMPSQEKGTSALFHMLEKDTVLSNKLNPIFNYPSDNHIGELREK